MKKSPISGSAYAFAVVVALFLGHACGNPDPRGEPSDNCIMAGTSCEPPPDASSPRGDVAGGRGGGGGSGGSAGTGGGTDTHPSNDSGGLRDGGGYDRSAGSPDTRAPVDASLLLNELTTDRWTPISSENAPSPRCCGAAVWTGQEMIVWGGRIPTGGVTLATGARYNPTTNAWKTMATLRAPTARYNHAAVWTGQEMIVWGGTDSNGALLDTGARYNPLTDTWTPMSREGVAERRENHVAAWAGTHMVIWGGRTMDNVQPPSPRRYDPATDAWSAVSEVDLPPSAENTRALWTGSELLLLGGFRRPPAEYLAGVGRYNPVTDSWRPFPIENAPVGHFGDLLVWTGREAILWGSIPAGPGSAAVLTSGAAFDAAAGTWRMISDLDQPAAGSSGGLAVFATGAGTRGTGLMLVVGGPYQGGAYDPASDHWWPLSMQGSIPGQFAFWTGRQVLVWGTSVNGDTAVPVGARYEP